MAEDDFSQAPDQLREAIERAGSNNWRARAEAATRLGDWITQPKIIQQLVLMLDDRDTAVTEAAVASLVRDPNLDGLAGVVKALGQDPHVADHIQAKLISLWFDGYPLVRLLEELTKKFASGPIRDGADEILIVLNGQE